MPLFVESVMKCKFIFNVFKKQFKLNFLIILIMTIIESNEPIVKNKRGRKSKQELMQTLNIQSLIDKIPKKETSEKKELQEISLNITEKEKEEKEEQEQEEPEKTNKKRGRKPKGGKIVQQISINSSQKEEKPNVILHLKCSLKDLQQSNSFMDTYNDCKNDLNFELIKEDIEEDDDESIYKDGNKELWKKLKQLEHNLHINSVNNKKSACFWDTCDFDNPPVYIPKHIINDTCQVYGCFCSPECAVAYLMNEKIDTSTKFERYHLLNNIYAKIYDYKQNIKPSPDPYYLLDKYCGNITIQDYRSLLKNERLFLIVDKPLTRVMPELIEDNDDFILNNKIIPTNSCYQLKNKLNRKKQNKKTILSEKFGNVE
jgi:hypothetical protein